MNRPSRPIWPLVLATLLPLAGCAADALEADFAQRRAFGTIDKYL